MSNKTKFLALSCGEEEISCEWVRKSVKNINLRVRADGMVYVSSPHFVSQKEMERFLAERADLIRKARDAVRQRSEKEMPVTLREGDRITLFGEERVLRFSSVCSSEVTEKDGFLTVFDLKNEEKTRKMLRKYGEERLKTLLSRSISAFLPYFSSVKMPEIRLRAMRRVWGNCRPKTGVLTFNSRLSGYPIPCIEYIVMHELCHFLVPDHSAKFYEALSARMPDWKERKTLLDTSSIRPFF